MKKLIAALAIAGAMAFGSAASAVIVVQHDLVFSSATPGANVQSLALYNVAGSTLTNVLIQWAPNVSVTGGVVLTSGSANTRTIYADLSLVSALTSSAFNLNTVMTGSTSNVSFSNPNRVRSATASLSGTNSLSPVDPLPFVGAGSVQVTNKFQNLLLTTVHTVTGGGGSVTAGSPSLGGGGVLRVIYTGTDVAVGPLPEPGTWLMMTVGFGLVGVGIRRRNRSAVVSA